MINQTKMAEVYQTLFLKCVFYDLTGYLRVLDCQRKQDIWQRQRGIFELLAGISHNSSGIL